MSKLERFCNGGGDCAEWAVALAVRAVLGEIAAEKEKKEKEPKILQP